MRGVVKKFTLLATLLTLVFTMTYVSAEEKIYSAETGITLGNWTTCENRVGYNEASVIKTDESGGELTWKGLMMTPGKYSLYIYNVVSEDASKNVTVKYFSDLDVGGTVSLDMTKGIGGWREICAYTVGEQGATVTLNGADGCLYASAIKFVKRPDEYDSLIVLAGQTEKSVVLKIGESRAFVNNLLSQIEDTVPELNGDTTFVPARFLAENLGCDILWNNDTREITVINGNDTIVFFEGSREYTLNGNMYELDNAVYIKDGRTMLPLRAISEGLGKRVYWDNRGIVIVSVNDVSVIAENEKHMTNIASLFEQEL